MKNKLKKPKLTQQEYLQAIQDLDFLINAANSIIESADSLSQYTEAEDLKNEYMFEKKLLEKEFEKKFIY